MIKIIKYKISIFFSNICCKKPYFICVIDSFSWYKTSLDNVALGVEKGYYTYFLAPVTTNSGDILLTTTGDYKFIATYIELF